MPSVTTPGLRMAPAGMTSFVPSLRVIAVLDGSTFLDSTLDRVRRFRGRRPRAAGRGAPLGLWRELRLGERLGERRGDKDRRGQHRNEQRERVHVSTLM